MKRSHRTRESATAALFLAALLLGALYLAAVYLFKDAARPDFSTGDSPADAANEAVNDALDRSHLFIQLYGGVQRLLGRRVLADVDETYTVYKLSDGSLTFVNPAPSDRIGAHAQAYLQLQDYLARREIPLRYVQAPCKIGGGEAPALPAGAADYSNDYADEFLALLQAGGGEALDLREVLAEDGRLWTSYFFTTDHHWKPETALLCAGALAAYLNDSCGLELDLSLADPARYTAQVYRRAFLGSQGKRAGTLYAGVDDFTVLTPDFATDFSYDYYDQERTGPFGQSLLFPEYLEEDDLFQSNLYAMYSGGDFPLARMVNRNNPDGPRILLLRDSYGCALAPFLALYCGELITVDLRYFPSDDTFLPYIDALEPDCVLVLYMPGSLKGESEFAFFR